MSNNQWGMDAVGNQVFDGDRVIFISRWNKDLRVGRIMWLTPHGATIMDDKYQTEINRPSSFFYRMEEQ